MSCNWSKRATQRKLSFIWDHVAQPQLTLQEQEEIQNNKLWSRSPFWTTYASETPRPRSHNIKDDKIHVFVLLDYSLRHFDKNDLMFLISRLSSPYFLLNVPQKRLENKLDAHLTSAIGPHQRLAHGHFS